MNDWQRTEFLAKELLGWRQDGIEWVDAKGRRTGYRVPWCVTARDLPDWDPSVNWRDAGEVAERMHQRGTHLVLLYDDLASLWVAKFPVGLQPAEASYGKTGPEAICRAAARALGAERDPPK